MIIGSTKMLFKNLQGLGHERHQLNVLFQFALLSQEITLRYMLSYAVSHNGTWTQIP